MFHKKLTKERRDNMKKLFKTKNNLDATLESYYCSCDCGSYCTTSCDCTPVDVLDTAEHSANVQEYSDDFSSGYDLAKY